jgi:hypothetical protein
LKLQIRHSTPLLIQSLKAKEKSGFQAKGVVESETGFGIGKPPDESSMSSSFESQEKQKR